MAATNPALRETWIRNKLRKLTLEQKVGQMIIAGFPGTTLTPEVAAMMQQCHMGGVMLGEANIESPRQVAALTAELQRLSLSDVSLPLFICIDQEGGAIRRLGSPATVMPSSMALGATRSIADVEACAMATARELWAVGINVNFAPVLDVNSEPANPVINIRSFGDSPTLVAEMGVAAVKAFRNGGIAATAKHFPGHGDAKIDSHLDLPVILRSLELLRSVDLLPFREAIANGVDMMMSAHAVYPTLTTTTMPATISREILSDLLRHQMGFDGLIITDALVMKAIADRYTLSEAAVLSVQAGADVVLTLGTLEEQAGVFADLLEAVRQGHISEADVDASVARILAVKRSIEHGSLGDDAGGTDFADWPLEDHQRIAREAAQKAITLVKNDGRLLPLGLKKDERLGLIEFSRNGLSPVEGDIYDDCSLHASMRQRHANLGYLRIDDIPQNGDPALRSFVEECDVVVVATRNAHMIRGQAAMVRRILEHGKPAILLALKSPYDLMSFPSAGTYVAAYGDCAISVDAAVALLFGEFQPRGKLPVAIPGLYPFGHGLERF